MWRSGTDNPAHPLGSLSPTQTYARHAHAVQARYDNGTHFWYEQSVKVIEDTCAGRPATTPLPVARYTLSSLAASQAAFVATAALFALYHVGAVQWLIRRVRERPPLATAAAPLPLVSSVMRSLNNAAFRPLLLAWALDGLALASLVTMFPFYIRYVVVPDGTAAEAKGQATDPQVRSAAVRARLDVICMCTSGSVWLLPVSPVGARARWVFAGVPPAQCMSNAGPAAGRLAETHTHEHMANWPWQRAGAHGGLRLWPPDHGHAGLGAVAVGVAPRGQVLRVAGVQRAQRGHQPHLSLYWRGRHVPHHRGRAAQWHPGALGSTAC